MAKKNWQNKNKVKKANDRRGKDAGNIALNALVELKNPLYAYKIYKSADRPLVADNGKANVILYDETIFENVIFDIEETKTKIEDADDGVKTKGRKITKYKVVSISNFTGNSSNYDIFSRSPIFEHTYDKKDLNIFTFEDNNGVFERDDITQTNTVKNGEAVSLISINSLPILKNQEISLEVYKELNDIPQEKSNYRVKQIGFRFPVKVGVGRITAKAIENSNEISLDMLIDDNKTSTNLFLSKFFVKDEERYDQEEAYLSPFNQLNWKDATKYFNLTAANTVLDVKDENEKWILNLIYGLAALYYLQDSNYASVNRDAEGNINDSVRGFALNKADEIKDSDINSGFIKYCLDKIETKQSLLIAYGYVAMLSKYIESKYTFAEPIYEYAQLWNFEFNFVYDATLKTVDDFSNEVKLKLFSNIYDIENTEQDPNNTPIYKITGIKAQFKSLSAIRNIGDVVTVDIESMDDQLVEHDISQFNGENENKDINKYFAFHATTKYNKLQEYYSQESSEIHKKGDVVVKDSLFTYNITEFYARLLEKNKEMAGILSTDPKIAKTILEIWTSQRYINLGWSTTKIYANIAGTLTGKTWNTANFFTPMLWNGPRTIEGGKVGYDGMLQHLNPYKFVPSFRQNNYDAMERIYKLKTLLEPVSPLYGTTLKQEILNDFTLISNKNGREFKINSVDERKYFIDYLTGALPDQDPLKNENVSLKQTLPDFSMQLKVQREYEYTIDVTVTALSKNNRIVDEQKILDRQIILNDSTKYEFWTKFEEQHASEISNILEIKLWTRYGGEFDYIKDYEYEDENGNIVTERKTYTYDLSATHAIENALTTIYDN